ncbi:MAG: nucleotidyltransferase family protein [Candidatus Omnitrophica bacterium]|nr:nucleotidyltransferase family protein [Candidatus Omnitrophota bacterium]
MKAVLLCAGYATRLYPLTENQPKPLLPVGGRPILEYILDRLRDIEEINGVYIATNHKFAGHFQKWTETLQYPWPVVTVDDQTLSNETRLGAIGDLAYVLKTQNIGVEDMMVIAGDNLFDFDLVQFVSFARSKRPHPLIAVYDVKDLELAKQYGLVVLDEDRKVLAFYEKPQEPPTTLASCGLYWLPAETRVLLDRYIREGHNADQPGHYMKWLSQVDTLYAAPLEGRWYDIGDLNSYQQADLIFRS